MTVALVHVISAWSGDLTQAWHDAFEPVDPNAQPPRAYGPELPDGVQAVSLALVDDHAVGLALCRTPAAAHDSEVEMRAFWTGLAGEPVSAGVAVPYWERDTKPNSTARMIWVMPT